MRHSVWWITLAVLGMSAFCQAQMESVYAPPAPPRPEEGVNVGGVNLDLTVRYLTDYVYRGVDRSDVGGHEDAPNLQFDGRLEFDLGKLPHPFIGLFSNVFNSDPVSRFQEIRPFFGADWTLRPFIFEFGHNTYIYPDRDAFETSEVYSKITFDDSILWHTEKPVLTPYVYGAYDYDLNKGWYLEAGIKHDFVIEDTGITITPTADVGFVQNYAHQFVFVSPQDSGPQHYDIGLVGTYSLNTLFNVSRRHGEFALQGYLYYTGSLSEGILATNQLWGGVGIAFRY
jgi:hypothetical protein